VSEAHAIYGQVLETLFKRVLQKRMTPALKVELKKAGLDLELPLPPQYSKARWKQAIDAIATALYPEDTTHDGHLQLGRLLVDEYRKTGWGMATVGLARMLGPQRLLHKVHELISGPGRGDHTRLEERGEGHFELWMQRPAISAAFTEGLLTSGLLATGVPEVEVEHLGGNAHKGHRFALRWG